MRRMVLIALTSACAHTVDVQVAPTPAVPVNATAFRVVAAERDCRPVADALARAIRHSPGLSVDPRADLRLDVYGCGESWQVDVESQTTSDGDTRRRLSLTGRAFAGAAVTEQGALRARLIATSSGGATDPWGGDASPFSGLRARARAGLENRVAQDLLTQLDPVPRSVERRVYARAPEGTARELHNLAVVAERWGDLDTAFFLAAQAHDARPTPRSASYVTDLARRRLYRAGATTPPPPAPSPD